MSGSLPGMAGKGREVKFRLSCNCTVTFITAPPKVREVILCHSCNRGVRILERITDEEFIMRKVG
jgi:hypothetical protein